MKSAFIFILYRTPEHEVERLKREFSDLGIKDSRIYFVDNATNNRGYAGGANEGIRKAMADGADLFVVANPDISLVGLKNKNLFQAAQHFDIYGFAMKQEGKIYYGGELDKWRMSGGLIEKKPGRRFSPVAFPSGSLFIIKRQVAEKIGLMDESYFLYYEEVDYCHRARQAGYKIGVDSGLTYEHFEVSKDNPTKNYYLFKSRLKFLIKYGSLKQKFYELIRSPKTIYEEIIKRPFYLNFFSMNVSSLVNKALHFVLFILLIRMFKPEDYAVYTLAWTHIGLLSPLLDFGTTSYGLVHLPGERKENQSRLFTFRVVLATVTFILTVILAFVFRYPPHILVPILLTSIVIFANMMSGSFLIFASVASRSYVASLVSMVFQILLVISLIASVLIRREMISIFVGIFVMYGLYALVNFILIKKQIGKLELKIDISGWVAIGRKSLVFLAITLLAGFYSKADVLLLNFLKGPKDVGLYSAGYRFLDALMFMVVAYNVSAMSIFSSMAKLKQKALFLGKIKKDVTLVALLGGFVAVSLSVFSPYVLPFLMKGDYESSIQVLRVIIFALPLILLSSVFLNGIYALGRAKTIVLLFLFQVIYNVVSNYLFIPIFGYIASAWITVIGEAMNTAITFIILRNSVNENFS